MSVEGIDRDTRYNRRTNMKEEQADSLALNFTKSVSEVQHEALDSIERTDSNVKDLGLINFDVVVALVKRSSKSSPMSRPRS